MACERRCERSAPGSCPLAEPAGSAFGHLRGSRHGSRSPAWRPLPSRSLHVRGPHAAYLDYEADDVVARGTITPTEVRIASATATAYGANVRLAGSTLAIDAPLRLSLRRKGERRGLAAGPARCAGAPRREHPGLRL
jgi:hypothetical protein